MISDFKKIINQEQTGAVDTIVREIVGARASRSPLFERGMSTRAARRSARTETVAAEAPSGLASEEKYPQYDAGDLAQRKAALEERKKRLEERRQKNKIATQDLESAIQTLGRADTEASVDESTPRLDPEIETDLAELESGRRSVARRPIGARPTGEEFLRRFEELKKNARVPIDPEDDKSEMKELSDSDIEEMLQDEFDANQEEISAGLRSARERGQRASNIKEAEVLAKTLVKYAKNKMYQIGMSGVDKKEEKTLQETIERIIRSEGGGASGEDLALLEKFGVSSETMDVASGDTGIMEKIGFSRERKGTPKRPGAQTADEVDKVGKLQQLILDAEKEAGQTGEDIGTVLAFKLAAAEDEQRKIDAQIALHQQEIERLEAVSRDQTSAQGGAYFRAIGLPDGRIARANPLSRVAGREISPEQQEMINDRARKIAARYPGGLEGMDANVLTLNPSWDANTGQSPRRLSEAEQYEGTVTRREIAENPITGLFRRRAIVPNAETPSGVQMTMPSIAPEQAGPALQFMEELFASLKIVMAGMAETLSQGRAVKPTDVQDLGVNLSILANLYEQIQNMDPGSNEGIKKIIADMKANFSALAESEDIAKLFSPGFVTERLGKSSGLSRTEKEGLALEVSGIAKSVSSGGERVVAGMQSYSEQRTRSYGGRVSTGPEPVDAAEAAERIKELAAKIRIAEPKDSEAIKKQLISLISSQISESDINPQDLLQLIQDPGLQKEIQDSFSRSVAAYRMEKVSTAEGEKVVGYEVQGGGRGGPERVQEGTRDVLDPAAQAETAALVERILSIEGVIAKISEDIDAIFSKDEREQSLSRREESKLLSEERSRQLEVAERRLKQVEDRLRLQAFLSGRAEKPSNLSSTKTGDVSEEIQRLGAESRTSLVPIQQDSFEEYQTKEEVGSQEDILSKFTRIRSVEDLQPFGKDANSALAFSSLPIALVQRLIKDNPGLAELATPNNPIEPGAMPKGGILKVGEEAARAVLEALEKAGVKISAGNFSNPDDPKSGTMVSVMHFAEKLAEDKFAAYVATGIAENIITSNTSGNALINVQTPEFTSYPNVGGRVVEDLAGYQAGVGINPSGVVRNIQIPRKTSEGKAVRPFGMKRTIAHEYGHTITRPFGKTKDAEEYLRNRISQAGVGEDQARSVSRYAATDQDELLAEAYAVLQGYTEDEGEEDISAGAPWSESLTKALVTIIEEAKSLTTKWSKTYSSRARADDLPSMMKGGLRGPAAGRGARAVADRSIVDKLYGDTIGGGASFAFDMSPSGAPEVTGNTPQSGFVVGGLNKRNFNLLPSDMVPEEIAPGMSEAQVQEITKQNQQKRQRFRVAVLQLMQENSAFIKQALSEGRQIYFGTYFDKSVGKIALDVSELIPFDPEDAAAEAKARAKAVADATTRNQQSVARIERVAGEGRGTGAGYGLNFDNPDAFPSTGLPGDANAMAGYRAWTGKRYTSSNLPDVPAAGGAPEAPTNFSGSIDEFDSMQKELEATLASDPESALAKDNLRMLLEARGMESDAIARRVDEVIRGVAAQASAAESESRKADAAESSAQEAEEFASLFEDFDESEYEDSGFIDDDTSNTSEIVEETRGSEQRTEVAAERVAEAKAEIAAATEEIATAVEVQADSAQATAAESSATEAAAVEPQVSAATTTRLEEIDAELKAIFDKKQELQQRLQEVVTDQALAAASVQDRIERALDTLEQVRLDRLADEMVQLELETDKEMVQREARFRRTEKGSKVNQKTGQYSYDYVPAVYGPENEEYKRLIAEGFTPDKDNAFSERDLVFAEKSQAFRYDISRPANLAEEVGLSPVRGGDATRTRLEDVQEYARRRQEGADTEVSPEEIDNAKAALEELKTITAPTAAEIRTLTAEIESLSAESRRVQANRDNLGASGGVSANDEAARINKDAILQKQIIPEQLAPIIELLNKTLATADQKLEARGIETSGLTAKDKAAALGDMDATARKLKYLIEVIESASRTVPATQGSGVFLPRTVLPSGTTGKTPDAQLKSASRITGMLPNEVSAVSGVIDRINAALKSLEAQAATGEVDLEALAASLQNVSSEARQTAASLLDTTAAEQEKAAAGGGDGRGGRGGGAATGGPTGPMDDPRGDWRNIRATVPDTENISRGISDLAKLQNRFAELGPVITHAAGANQQFGQSLDYSAARAEKASETLQRLTDTNVGVLKTVRTQVGRAATFLVLQQLGREIGGIVQHLQGGVFQFNQVLENTQVGFNTLFANTLQANASVGNQLIPKLNEAGRQIGFMREQSVKFSDALNYTAGAAANMVEEIRVIADVTPFRFKPLVEASLKMKAFGFEASEIPGMINSISNAVAALGGEDEKIDRIAYALGQMNSAGRVYQNDMMQLANAGIAGYRMLSEKLLMDLTAMKNRSLGMLADVPEETVKEFEKLTGMLNSSEFKRSFGSIDDMIRTLEDPKRAEGLIRNLAKRGFLIGSTAARAITEGMDKQYQGSADRLSRTMTGALSTIADLTQNFMAQAFSPLYASIRDTIVEVGQFMLKTTEIIKFVDGVKDSMQKFITSLASFGPALESAGQIFIDIFVSGLGSALDTGTQFGSVMSGIIGQLGPGLRLIGDILTNDVGKGLVVATLAFSLFSKAISTNPMIATVTLLVAAISGIAAAIQDNTLFVGSFVKTFVPSIEQLLKVIGEGVGTVLEAFSGSAMTGFIAGLSVAINALMPLLTIFLTTMSVLLKVLTPLAGPLGFIVGLFIALKTAMMAFDLAGTVVGKVMNGINSAWGSVNNAIDTQIDKVKQTAAAYDELKRAKIAAEDFKRNDRGELLDENNQVTRDKSKAALMWGQGEKIESYGMSDFRGRMAERALSGGSIVPGLLAVDRTRQRATDEMQNMMAPDFGQGFYLSHEDRVLGHTTPVIDNKKIEGTFDYLNLAGKRKKQFETENAEAIMDQTLTPDQQGQYKNLQEAAKLREQASVSGMFRFAGLDMGKTDTEKINDNAGAYSMDNMWGAILVQKETSWILNKAFTDLEAAGKQIEAMKSEVEKIKAAMESGEITTEDGEARISQLRSSMEGIRRGQAGNMSIVGGLAEAGVPVMDQDGKVDPEAVKRLTVDDFGKRGINIPPGVASGIKKLPENVQNIVLSKVLERYAKGEVFATKQEEEQFLKGVLGEARGKAAIKGSTVGVFNKAGNAMGNLFKTITDRAPRMLKTIERGGGKSGLSEIDSRGGKYYYVDSETGALGDQEVSPEELKRRERMRGFQKGGIMDRMRGSASILGKAAVGAGLASGARRLAGEVAPIMAAPIIGPLMELLPKEMTNVLKQKAGPFQAMAQGIGTTAGSIIGQALIPIPGVGAMLGGLIGGALAEFVGNAIDRAIAGSEEAIAQKKALMEEAKFLGFTEEQSKEIAREKFAGGGPDFITQGGGIPGFTTDPTDEDLLSTILGAYTVGEKKNIYSMGEMGDAEYNRRIQEIRNTVPEDQRAQEEARLNQEREQRKLGVMTDDEYKKKRNEIEAMREVEGTTPQQIEAALQELEKQRAYRSGSNAFDVRQAEFMNAGMDYETIARYAGEENILAKQKLAILRKENEATILSIEGKLARGEELSASESALNDEIKKLTAAAAESPIGLFGTLIDPKLFSPKQIQMALDNSLRRNVYTAEDAANNVTDATGKVVTEGQARSGFSSLEDLMGNANIQSLTAQAGFGGKTADALVALGFDYSKVTRDTTDQEIIELMKETLRIGAQARVRGQELMPKVDMTLSRLEMMERYGGETGYKMFDKYTEDRAKYQVADKEYQRLGGDARIGLLQEIQSQNIAPRYIVQGRTDLGRDQYGGQDTGTAVRYGPENLLTASEEEELKKLTAAQKERTDARYKDLTATLQIRMSTMGATSAEVAQGVAAEKAYAEFRTTNQAKLAAALKAGKNATAEQLALLKEDTATRDKAYKTQEVTLAVGDALQAVEAAGLQISDKELANNVALQKILLLKQRVIEANGGAALSMVAAQVAEARAADLIVDIKLKQVELEKILLAQTEAKHRLEEAAKNLAERNTAENQRAYDGAVRNAQNAGRNVANIQKAIAELSAKAAQFMDDAAKANPMKLTKKELEEIKKLIAKDPGSILGGDGGTKANQSLQKSLDLLNKISTVAGKAYDRMRKEQQRTHDEYIKQLDEQEKRINERYKQRSDIQTEENLQAQLQISGLQMRSASADPLEAAKSFYDAKQALEQFYIDQQRDAELKVVADEKERYEKQFNDSSTASQAVYEAALQRLNSRFEFAQQVLNGDEKMAGKMNDALRLTMLGNNFGEMGGIDGVTSREANTAFKDYSGSAISVALQKQYGVQTIGALYKKYTAISSSKRTTAQKALISEYNRRLAAARKESAVNAMIEAVSGRLGGDQDITMATNAEQDLAAFESSNRDAIAAALDANENITTEQEDLLAQLSEMRALAEASQKDALLGALGSIGKGTLYNSGNQFNAVGGGFTGGIKGLTYGGAAVTGANVQDVLRVYQGSTEESGLAATFLNEARMAGFRYTDQKTGKEYAGAGNILSYLVEVVNNMGGGALGVSKLNDEQGALYQYLMTLVSAKNTFTSAQKTAILAQRTLEQGLNDFEQSTGVDINIANLAEADITDKQFTDYFNALGKTFEDNAAREEAIQKMRDVLRDTYGQALLSVDVEQYAKFADSSDARIGKLSNVANSLKDVMDQIDGIMSAGSASKMTSLDKLLFGADFDPSNLSGTGPVSNLQFGKTQIDAVTTAVAATRDAFESSMNSIKAYASELSGPLGAFHQQTIEDAGTIGTAMATAASSFSLATVQVNMYAEALAAAAAAKEALGIDPNFATGIGTNGATGSVTPAANNTYNITVNNAEGMDAQQLAAELARLIAQQAGSTVN